MPTLTLPEWPLFTLLRSRSNEAMKSLHWAVFLEISAPPRPDTHWIQCLEAWGLAWIGIVNNNLLGPATSLQSTGSLISWVHHRKSSWCHSHWSINIMQLKKRSKSLIITFLNNNKHREQLLVLIKNWIHDWQLTVAVPGCKNHLIASTFPLLKFHNNTGCHYRQGDVNLSSVRKLLRTDSHWWGGDHG